MPAKTTSVRPSKRLVVFCDGTWVGRETRIPNTSHSNIRQIANMVGEVLYSGDATKQPAKVYPIVPHGAKAQSSDEADIVAGYQEGVGLNRTFLEYLFDGATASDIGDECINVYKFIVENYTDEHEIWLFGFSRGSFTVRCVAGMINNCGIIKRLDEYTSEQVDRLCYEVFRTYRSDQPVDAPKSEECQRQRGDAERVWQTAQPIRFMGIIDTVGALGIPRLNAGIGTDWGPLQFFDQHASSIIQNVHHAAALHDRLWAFQPCPIYPSLAEDKPKSTIKQVWFPGTHYDLGRMPFRFIRQSPANRLEGLLGLLPDLLSRTVYPNEVLGDTVLRWLVEGVQEVDAYSENPIIPDMKQQVQSLGERLATPTRKDTGSGDIYGDIVNYAPGGIIFTAIQRTCRLTTAALNRLFPQLGDNIQDLLGIKVILGALTATADRRIPDIDAKVYPYKKWESVVVNGGEKVFSVEQAGKMQGINQWGKERYASKTYETFLLWKRVFGRRKAT